jgi:hypothetical protein
MKHLRYLQMSMSARRPTVDVTDNVPTGLAVLFALAQSASGWLPTERNASVRKILFFLIFISRVCLVSFYHLLSPFFLPYRCQRMFIA